MKRRDRQPVERLLEQRWMEAQQRVTPLGPVKLTWDVGDYAHFDSPRGYAVTFNWGKPHCHLRVAAKLARAPRHRIDGIIQHEIGHVVDLTCPKAKLDAWAVSQGIQLPSTDERRADAIAEAIWGTPIYYTKPLLVQSTDPTNAITPRPRHLGL